MSSNADTKEDLKPFELLCTDLDDPADSDLSSLRLFGQLSPELTVRRNMRLALPETPARAGLGDEEIMNWARPVLVVLTGVVAAPLVPPARRSHSWSVGSACGEFMASASFFRSISG